MARVDAHRVASPRAHMVSQHALSPTMADPANTWEASLTRQSLKEVVEGEMEGMERHTQANGELTTWVAYVPAYVSRRSPMEDGVTLMATPCQEETVFW